MLFGRTPSEGLEPMGIVSSPAADRPIAHGCGHLIGHMAVYLAALAYGGHHTLEGLACHTLAHCLLMEDIAGK